MISRAERLPDRLRSADISTGLLERLIDAVVNGCLVVPPITRVKLDDVPALNRNAHADGRRSSSCEQRTSRVRPP